MSAEFIEGTVKYPEDLPCPQVDTDLVPRERRYISDITDVRNMRMFQQEFQATRNRISFIFTEEEAAEFRDWYENDIIYGGAWFYADWPILHKDKQIPYRFVGQPKYEWLLGANPGAMGRSAAGYNPAVDAVTMYKVTATVELYERKVGKTANVYTSKIYPYYFADDIKATNITAKPSPTASVADNITASQIIIAGAVMSGYIYSDYTFTDDITVTPITIPEATMIRWIYSNTAFDDDVSASPITISEAEITARRVNYTYFEDAITASHITIIAGELT